MRTKLLLIYLAVLSITACQPQTSEPWHELFNGKDFKGWNQKGGEAVYTVENNEVVGASTWDTPNSFMCTDELFSDFILEFEVKVDERLNSGVQIRSNSLPEYKDGRVHGYQCEIDPSERAWSGGIYDEARRGWLYPVTMNPQAKVAFKNGEWNKYRVEAIGSHFKIWINGIAVTNLWDEMTQKGFIGLQVHAINDSSVLGSQVRWKNIRIITENPAKYQKETDAPEVSRLVNKLTTNEQAAGWKLLFDSKTTTGWRGAHKTAFPEKGWEVKDGILSVLSSDGAESENGGDIVTEDEYSAFELQLEFKITEGANSGIKYFVTEKEEPSGSAFGLEYQILDDYNHPDAHKYTSVPDSRSVASLYDMIKAENKRFSGPGQWNEARLVVYPNNHVEHWLNGMKVLEYDRKSEAFEELVKKSKYAAAKYNAHGKFGEADAGHILLQDHGDNVSFRSIKIKVLTQSCN